jgi:hypothetical protein
MRTPSVLNHSTHYLDEAMKFGYGQRTLLGDPTFLPNLTAYQLEMYPETTATEFRSKIEENAVLETKDYCVSPGSNLDRHRVVFLERWAICVLLMPHSNRNLQHFLIPLSLLLLRCPDVT